METGRCVTEEGRTEWRQRRCCWLQTRRKHLGWKPGRKFRDPSPVLLTLDGRGVSNTNKQLVHMLTQRFLSSGMKNKKSVPLPIQVLQALFGTKREISIIPVEAFFFLRAPAFRQERAECFTRLVCLSSVSQAACLAHKNAGKTPSSAAPLTGRIASAWAIQLFHQNVRVLRRRTGVLWAALWGNQRCSVGFIVCFPSMEHCPGQFSQPSLDPLCVCVSVCPCVSVCVYFSWTSPSSQISSLTFLSVAVMLDHPDLI